MERRSLTSDFSNPADWLLKWLGLGSFAGKVNVNATTSLGLSAVYRAVNIRGDVMASLPLKLMQQTGANRTEATAHRLTLLLNEPNSLQTGVVFRRYLQNSKDMHGNAYAFIERDDNNFPIALYPLHPHCVTPFVKDRQPYYRVVLEGKMYILGRYDVLHLQGMVVAADGITGLNPIQAHAQTLGISLNAQGYGLKMFENGMATNLVLQTDEHLKTEQRRELRESISKMHSGMQNSGKPFLLEGGLKASSLTLNPADIQFIENRKFTIPEVARIFGVPPHMLFDMEGSTFNNVEQQNQSFVTYALSIEAAVWEQELCSKLLAEREKPTHYFNFKFQALLRGDVAARANWYSKMFASGILSQNMILGFEDLPHIDGGDRHYIPLNLIPSDLVDKYYESVIAGKAMAPSTTGQGSGEGNNPDGNN